MVPELWQQFEASSGCSRELGMLYNVSSWIRSTDTLFIKCDASNWIRVCLQPFNDGDPYWPLMTVRHTIKTSTIRGPESFSGWVPGWVFGSISTWIKIVGLSLPNSSFTPKAFRLKVMDWKNQTAAINHRLLVLFFGFFSYHFIDWLVIWQTGPLVAAENIQQNWRLKLVRMHGLRSPT